MLHTFNLFKDGKIAIPFGSMPAPYDTPEARLGLQEQVNAAAREAVVSEGMTDRYPSVPLDTLTDGDRVKTFESVWDWYFDECMRCAKIE
ncbi:MAG: hypothetical protein OEW85_14140 [Acidimicrobiia bacterium]|nr:hypothetical protein [Acidimicrobiia bacterium]